MFNLFRKKLTRTEAEAQGWKRVELTGLMYDRVVPGRYEWVIGEVDGSIYLDNVKYEEIRKVN